MNNYLKVLILLLLVLLILFTIYMIMDVPKSKDTEENVPMQTQAIKIAPLEIKPAISLEKEYLPILPIDILSKLRSASEQSKEAIVPSKEERSNNILNSLKKKVEAQTIKKVVIKKVSIKPKPMKKKIVIKKRVVIKKKAVPKKKIIKKKIIIKKATKTKVNTKVTSNKPSNNNIEKKVISPEEEGILPDSYYFEPIEEVKTVTNNAPLKFVKKLGVVSKSANYETAFMVPKKEELAREGIVNISSASLETQEMKKLEFVNTLGVVQVSKDFETLDADKHLN